MQQHSDNQLESSCNTTPRLIVVDDFDYADLSESESFYNGPREEAERALKEFPPDLNNGLSMKLALYLVLTDMYVDENCFEAALVAMRRAEPIFLKLVKCSEDWVEPTEVQFFLDRMCHLEQFDEARRIAKATMDILRQRADYEPGDESWLLTTWDEAIDSCERRHKRRVKEINNAPNIEGEIISDETHGLRMVIASYVMQSMEYNRS